MSGPAALLLIWQLISVAGVFENTLVSSPKLTFQALLAELSDSTIYFHIFATLSRMFVGFFFAGVFGVATGLLLGSYKNLNTASNGILDFFRSTPVTTLYPVFVLAFGIGHMSKIAMVFWASYFVVAINSAYGVKHSSQTRKQVAELFGASKFQILRWVTLYDAMPQIVVGLRIGLSYALIVEVLCEMFMGSNYGLGQRVSDAYATYSIQQLYAIVVITGTTGLIVNKIFLYIESNFSYWDSHEHKN